MHVESETSHLVFMCQSVINTSGLQVNMQSLSTDVLTNLSMHCIPLSRNIKTTDVMLAASLLVNLELCLSRKAPFKTKL